jgi:hypothetical protein
MTDQQGLIQRLAELPIIVYEAELEYLDWQNKFQEVKQEILELEVKLINEGKVEMKNEMTRNASILPHTEPLHKKRIISEYEMQKAKALFYSLKHEMENLRVIGNLLLNK